MTWNNQAESMMKLWTEAQRTMWQSWYDTVQAASTPAMFDPGVIEEWRKLANQGVEMWTGNIDPAFRNVSNQLMGSQAALMQMLQFTTSAWQSMAPKLDAGEDWNTVLTNYVEQVRQQMMPNAKSITQTTQDTAELWRTYMQQMQSMMQPWMGVAQQAPGMLTGMMSGNGASNLVEFTRMSWDTFGKTFGSTTLSPSFGLTRELEEKMAKAFAAWQELQEAASEYQVMMNEGWSNVFQQVLQDMKARADQDKPIESLSDLMRVWLSAADKSFDKVFRSETYATVQGRFVTKYMEYRVLEQVVAEEMLKYAYVPSRGEMDEAHRNIYELRKEVRSLKKALNSEKPKGRGRKNEQPAEQHQG